MTNNLLLAVSITSMSQYAQPEITGEILLIRLSSGFWPGDQQATQQHECQVTISLWSGIGGLCGSLHASPCH